MSKGISLQALRYREKRQQILDSAARLFAQKGYEKASLEEIALKLKLTKASLYHYVKGKKEILFHIQMQAIKEAIRVLDEVSMSEADPVAKLTEAIMSHVRIVTSGHLINNLKDQELILPRKLRARVVAERNKFEKGFQKIVLEGMECGVFQTLNWKMATKAALGALNRIPTWYSPRGELSPEQIGEAMVDFILKGFGVNQTPGFDKPA